MLVLQNHLTIMGVATCNVAALPELTASRSIVLVTEPRNLNTKRIDDTYVALHKSLRRQMFRQAGGYGTPQRLTIADYTVSFTCIHDTTPYVHETDIDRQEDFTR